MMMNRFDDVNIAIVVAFGSFHVHPRISAAHHHSIGGDNAMTFDISRPSFVYY